MCPFVQGDQFLPPTVGSVPTHRLRTKTRLHEPEFVPDDDPAPEDLPQLRSRRPDPLPSERVQYEHSITHIPYQSWCPICVAARGKSDPHKAVGSASTSLPQVAFDFAFFREGRGTLNVPVLVCVEPVRIHSSAPPSRGSRLDLSVQFQLTWHTLLYHPVVE